MNTRQGPDRIVEAQRQFFRSGKTQPLSFRLDRLSKLKQILKENEELFYDALYSDFKKSRFETYGTELGLLYEEIDLCRNKLRSWAKPQKVSGSLVNFPSKNYIHSQPYGVALVIGASNYPVLLSLKPMVSAIAAGNTAIVKPSELAAHTSSLMAQLINREFDPGFLAVVEGGADTTQQLLDQPLDYIFFTGSANVGRIVMKAAAEQLTPVTLELGGKSPAIVDASADLEVASRRIVWGKFTNAGQTCVAPDYVYVHSSVKDTLIGLMKGAIRSFYGQDPLESPDYPSIITEKKFLKLSELLTNGTVVAGGQTDPEQRYISPTILDNITWQDPIMQEEIFGPLLPVLVFDELEEAITEINYRPTPLSLYLFSSRSEQQKRVVREVEFGGGCINDTMMHFGNPALPFGGKGQSGMGKYQGKWGYDTFSHKKSILKKPTWLDFSIRYPPYAGNLKWIKKILN